MTQTEFDIVLFGATGFVGKLTVEHLAAHAPEGTRIALAGRSQSKLEEVRAEVAGAANWPVVVADSSDEPSLAAMAARTKVVITTVGPYARYGLPLVAACAEAGTDYVDLTGEVLFHRDAIDGYDARARETGARIVPSCGYDSVPSDLAVWQLAQQAAADQAGTLGETTTYATLKGGLSGGTIASGLHQLDEIKDKGRRRIAGDPFGLSPDRAAEPSGEFKDSPTVAYSDEIHSWTAPFVMASYNTRVVRRSNALLHHAYGASFRYREVMRTGDGLGGRATAYGVLGGLGAFMGAASSPLRPIVERFVPKPGTGPDEKSRAAGFFRMDARTTTTTGAHYRSIVSAQGDPGYAATCVMLGEAALTLALDVPEGAGGLLTPATALGAPYVDRLTAQGFSFKVDRLDA